MSSATRRVDVVVVGGGTAGAGAALHLARQGRTVVVLERRRAERGGAQWHNGVLDWQFERAGIAPPAPPERGPSGGTTHLVGPDGTRGVTVRDSPIVRADMARLGSRLRSLAQDAGAEVVDRVTALDVVVRGDRVTAVEVRLGDDRPDGRSGGRSGGSGTGAGRSDRFEAPLVVDASGRQGVVRRRSAALVRWCPPVRGPELCTATDHHVEVADRGGAERFLDRHGALPGEGVTVVGVDGGWSTRAITVSEDLRTASVLVGCVADGRHSTGPRMLAATRAAEPWLGATISGGSGTIPLRRPYARFTAPGVALVGDAACQVFPAHGSGIGFGLIAGRMLADAVAASDDPGDEHVLWRYQAAFQHGYGGLLAAFDGFRRMSTALGSDGVARMVRAGLLTEEMTRAGLDQRWQPPSAAAVPAMAARLARVPDVAATMLPMLARGQLLRRVGARHPSLPDEAELARWDAGVERLLGPPPA